VLRAARAFVVTLRTTRHGKLLFYWRFLQFAIWLPQRACCKTDFAADVWKAKGKNAAGNSVSPPCAFVPPQAAAGRRFSGFPVSQIY